MNELTYDRIKECVKNGGCVNLRTYSAGVDHYVTITKVTVDTFGKVYKVNKIK